jgi:hypothetical protein
MFKIIVLLFALGSYFVYGYNDRVLLTSVQSLTFVKDAYTTGRRNSPIKQLQCVSSIACTYAHTVQAIQCVNIGTNDRNEVQWKCETELDKRIRLGNTIVSCEGYDNSDDPYILKGSCGLEYSMHFANSDNNIMGKSSSSYHDQNKNREQDYFQFFFLLFCVVIICIFLLSFCKSRSYGNNGTTSHVYHHNSYNSGPGFWSGYWLGSSYGQTGSRSYSDGSSYYGSPSGSNFTGTSTSTGYGTTKKR